MSMSDPLNHLGSILYHSVPQEVPYSPNQYLDRDFFATFYSKATVAPLRDYSVFFVGLFVGIYMIYLCRYCPSKVGVG